MKRFASLLVPCLLTARVACRRHQVNPVNIRFQPPISINRNNILELRAGDEAPPAKSSTVTLSTDSAVTLGCLLSFNSGAINGACLSGFLHPNNVKQAGAAVTGAWTNSALGAASRDMAQFAFQSKCIASYFVGSFTAGLVNPNPVPFEVDIRAARITFLIGSVLLMLTAYLSSEGSANFIFVAAAACGLQNSLTSTATANLVRSSHFSGITSDMGTFLGQVLRGNNQNLLKLKVFAALAASFWTGGYFSYGWAKNNGQGIFAIGSVFYFLSALLGLGVIEPLGDFCSIFS